VTQLTSGQRVDQLERELLAAFDVALLSPLQRSDIRRHAVLITLADEASNGLLVGAAVETSDLLRLVEMANAARAQHSAMLAAQPVRGEADPRFGRLGDAGRLAFGRLCSVLYGAEPCQLTEDEGNALDYVSAVFAGERARYSPASLCTAWDRRDQLQQQVDLYQTTVIAQLTQRAELLFAESEGLRTQIDQMRAELDRLRSADALPLLPPPENVVPLRSSA
jgi:hypothetical protein